MRSAHESYAPLLRPGDRFSHTTAATLWGMPLPMRLDKALHVTAGPGLQRPRSREVVGHLSSDHSSVMRGGVPVSTPLGTFFELARMLSHVELVAVADYLLLDPRVLDPWIERPLVSAADLRAAAAASRARGSRAARAAAAAAREGVESAMETALRLILVTASLPEPECGFHLAGVGWFDLAWPEYKVIAEYDGDQHRTSTGQYERDILRFDLAADLDWRVLRVRKRGVLVEPDTTVRRVSAALSRNGWMPSGRKSANRGNG